MRKINCIAIDGDESDLKVTCQHINSIAFFKLYGSFKNTEDAAAALKTQKADVLFLDVENSGISDIKSLQCISYGTRVIVTTKSGHHALEAFNLGVLDYVQKPLNKQRFRKAADKAYELFSLLNLRDKRNDQIEVFSSGQEYLFVNAEYARIKIKLADVTYVEGLKDYLKIFLIGQADPVITRMTMKVLEEKLPRSQFFRVHRSYIVSIDKIDIIRSQRIKIGLSTVPISDGYYETFRQKVNI